MAGELPNYVASALEDLDKLARPSPRWRTSRRARARRRELRTQLVEGLSDWFEWSASAAQTVAQCWHARQPFILFLRSFTLDGVFESHFEAVFEKVASGTPVISLAGYGLRENDVFPRLAVPDEEWSAMMTRLVRAAQAIIIHAAEASLGLVTELRLIRMAGREAATLVVPGVTLEAALRRDGGDFSSILESGLASPEEWSRAIRAYSTAVSLGTMPLDPRLASELRDYPHVVDHGSFGELQETVGRFIKARLEAPNEGNFAGGAPKLGQLGDVESLGLAATLASADIERAVRAHFEESNLDLAEHLLHRGLVSAWISRNEDLQLSALLHLGLLQLDREDHAAATVTLARAVRQARRLGRPVQLTSGTLAAVRVLVADGSAQRVAEARRLLQLACTNKAIREVHWRRAMMKHAESLVLEAEGRLSESAAALEEAIRDYGQHRASGGRPVGNRAAQVARVAARLEEASVEQVHAEVKRTPMPRDLRSSLVSVLGRRSARGWNRSSRADVAEIAEFMRLVERLSPDH